MLRRTGMHTEEQYLVTAVRKGKVLEFVRSDVKTAFETKRRLVAMGWLVDVSDPYKVKAESSRRMRAAQAVAR